MRIRFFAVFSILLASVFMLLGSIVGCRFISNDQLNQSIARKDKATISAQLSKGADVNGRGMHAMTPLMCAAKVGDLEICNLLIQKGADVNGHNDSGSVLMWAVDSGNEDVVRRILVSGANRSWTNELGGTAETLAREQGKPRLAELVRPATTPTAAAK